MKKGKIDGCIMDIIVAKDYDNTCSEFTAIERNGIAYPIRGKSSNKPGAYIEGPAIFYKEPAESEKDNYSVNKNVIDFNNVNMKELIEKSTKLRNMEAEILTNPDNIFIPKPNVHDEPEMKVLKQAICEKHIDIEKYKGRFKQWNNDRRIINKHKISLGKMKTWTDALDIKVTLILEDKSPDVPNPMGKKIIMCLDDGDSILNEEISTEEDIEEEEELQEDDD